MPAQKTQDRPAKFASEGRPLVGMLHLPEGARRDIGVVFCDAFEDERRTTCLAMTRLAREVAARGFAALRFDYWGCGDSPGDFADATVSTRLADIRSASAFLRAEAGVRKLCLLGLRFGATLASQAAEGTADCAALVLIQPEPDGKAYVDSLIKRKLVRGMITRAQGGEQVGGAGADVIDLDGYALTQRTVKEMRECIIAPGRVAFRGPVLVVQISFNESIRPEARAVCAAYEGAGAKVDVRALVMPPLWSRIDVTATEALNEAVGQWLEGAGDR